MKPKVEHWQGWEIKEFPNSSSKGRRIECRHPAMVGVVITFEPDYKAPWGTFYKREIKFGNNNKHHRLWFDHFDKIHELIKYIELWVPDSWWERD